jgi:inward rectifier potassium channel
MSTKAVKITRITAPGADYEVRIIGQHRQPLLDFYFGLLRLTWTSTLLLIAVVFLAANALFALGYLATGGIKHAEPGSFMDAFFFSVQTMGTIGYGDLYPATRSANLLVVAETIVGLTLTALFTGLIFAKFSRPTARVVFTQKAVISPMDGVPTMSFRLGNARGNQIVDVKINAVMIRSEHTAEGKTFYRMVDLKLSRGHALSLSRSWSVFHVIDAKSPLFGQTSQSLAEQEVEFQILMVGLDDTSMQIIHASHRYFANQVIWNARFADVLSESGDGALVMDLRKFNEIERDVTKDSYPA